MTENQYSSLGFQKCRTWQRKQQNMPLCWTVFQSHDALLCHMTQDGATWVLGYPETFRVQMNLKPLRYKKCLNNFILLYAKRK